MHIRRDISPEDQATRCSSGSYVDQFDVDVLIVGAGFSGVYLLHKLRDEHGLSVKVYEAGTDLGGTWHWNCYPGARVDSAVPAYELSLDKAWRNWTWTEKYAGWKELREYFAHLDNVLDIKKDVAFNTRVVHANFDLTTNKWNVETEDGRTATATYLIPATGFATKRRFPDWKGIDSFRGLVYHSSSWPDTSVKIGSKRVGVIGTGPTGVQMVQECAKEAGELTVFQRTPNLALPMQQRRLTKEEQEAMKGFYPRLFESRPRTFTGLYFDWYDKKTFDDGAEDREKMYQCLWSTGGFCFWLGSYKDLLFDEAANREAYNFWARKTRARIQDPIKRNLLAPLEPPYPFGTVRPSLEQNYYEQFNRDNVHLVNVKNNPIKEIVPEGVMLEDGTVHELDVIAVATGFELLTGAIKDMGLKSVHSIDVKDKWDQGVRSYLGMTCAGFPNMFYVCGPQCMLPKSFFRHGIGQQANILQLHPASPMDLVASRPKATGSWTSSRQCARKASNASMPQRKRSGNGTSRSRSWRQKRFSRAARPRAGDGETSCLS